MDWNRLSTSVSESAPRDWFKRLKSEIGKTAGRLALRDGARLMVCGNSFVSGAYGFCFRGISREKERAYLLDLTQKLRKEEKDVVAVLMKDLPPEEAGFWAQDGYQRFFADPNMRLRLRPEWNSFDDYVQAMSSKYRQRLRSAYKKSKGLEHRWLSADEVRSYQAEIFDLFSEVLREDQFSLLDVPKGYFTLFKEKLGTGFRVKAYFLGGEPVAFFTALQNGTCLEAHYIGYKTDLNHDLKLYQRILYDLAKLTFETRSEVLSLGRTAMGIKSCLGARPEQLGLFLRISNPLIRHLARPILRRLKPTPWKLRHPFKQSQESLSKKARIQASVLE
jgi:hypothetical protein